ncbi:hypothetical protein A2U01_0073185 [Trifolium medium]|uniref:Uncharacterized protein n=1 Tax=Trifolium medium TaxID=97028 RepID=A0A392SSV2_9FABA|nr:hypothetical protein [Trifolium medium]
MLQNYDPPWDDDPPGVKNGWLGPNRSASSCLAKAAAWAS